MVVYLGQVGFNYFGLEFIVKTPFGVTIGTHFRLFGTFQEEKPQEEIVYGLVDQPMHFNVIKHQFFYFYNLYMKTDVNCTLVDNIKKYFYGPGWFPNLNLPRLGDNNLVEEKPNRLNYTR